jgi:hypothetical protein
MSAIEHGTCPLCEQVADLEPRSDERQWLITCPSCRRFTIDADLLAVLRNPVTRADPRVHELLPLLSRASAATWAEGGRLNISLENWRAVAHDADAGHVIQ